MTKLLFRDLRADEIDCRIGTINEKGLTLLLYKDARCDMAILDETVGAFNWQRTHSRDNANCTVSIWDEDKKVWVSKEDTGTESNTEAAKGLASDSFKRCCVNWGIGRELYTAPFIWIDSAFYKASQRNDGKWMTYDKFFVKDIAVKDKKIVGLSICHEKTGKVCYVYGDTTAKKEQPIATSNPEPKKTQAKTTQQQSAKQAPAKEEMPHRIELRKFLEENNMTKEEKAEIARACGLNNSSTDADYELALVYARTMYMTGGQG